MVIENLNPDLRFPEFTDNWTKKLLSDFMTFKNGINASKENYGSGYKFINVLDIIQNDFITHDKIIGSVNIDVSDFNKNIVEFGDILFQRSSETREEVGQANVYLDNDSPATFGGFVIRGKKKSDFDPRFMNYLLKTSKARNEITSKSGGSTRYNVGQNTLSKVTIHVPNTAKEQEKIGTFLFKIETYIKLLNKKKDVLKEYKKGAIQKVFSQEIRFKDNEGNEFPNWRAESLRNLCKISKGQQLNKSELFDTGKYPCQNGGINPSGYTNLFNTDKNTITISEGGNSCGYVNFLKTKFWAGGHCYKLTDLKLFIDNIFLYQTLKYNQNKIMKLRVGSGLPNIQIGDIGNFKIEYPILDEQLKISTFLTSIDDSIANIEKKINNVIIFKQGLLQKMFV